jgi:N-methylhydantoinase B
MRTDKHLITPQGTADGNDGKKGACIINPGAPGEKRLPSRFGDYILRKEDLLRLERPGGGGMGDPLRRPVEMVLDDVRRGYVSIESARLEYGVALILDNSGWTVDEGATRALRESEKKAGKKNIPLL